MVYVKYLKDTGDIVEWGERVILEPSYGIIEIEDDMSQFILLAARVVNGVLIWDTEILNRLKNE